ncbi:MAG: hypothetical protein KTR16_10390 [Acidiferrobacterales bacterium]|nr:hypothetical protein [Acidiferrobacterales bacterium]
MIKSLTVLKAGLIAAALAFSFSVFTHAVEPDGDSAVSQNFKKVGRSFRGISGAKTAEELLEILQTARESLVANKDEVPSFMEADSPQLQEFIDGVDDTIARLDKAIALAQADDYEGAMVQFQEVRGAKDEYHEKFELEE